MPDPIKKRTRGEMTMIVVFTLVTVTIGVMLLVGELRLILIQAVQNFASSVAGKITAVYIPPSVVIFVLIAVAIVTAYESLRRVILQAFPRHNNEEFCPRCGKVIHVIHRPWTDRLVSFVLRGHLHRYRCFACGWTGLHRQRKHHQ